MRSRTLLSPDPNASGGGNTTATPEVPPKAETPAPPPAEQPKAPAPPAPNPLAADVAALRAQVAEFEREKSERERIAREAEEETLRKKGEFEKLIKNTSDRLEAEKQRATAAEERSKTYALNTQLALALAKHDLVEGSAEDLSELWRKDFEVVPDADAWAVRSKDGRPVSDVITERLTSARYSNHVRAQSRSGSGGGNGQVPAPTPSSTPADPAQRLAAQLKASIEGTRGGAPGLDGTYGGRNLVRNN